MFSVSEYPTKLVIDLSNCLINTLWSFVYNVLLSTTYEVLLGSTVNLSNLSQPENTYVE